MSITPKLVERILGRSLSGNQLSNLTSITSSLNKYGKLVQLDQPHRVAQFLAQIIHESGEFRYDHEVWGPTYAQKRYDTRTDLGNTPERDGDGFLFRGRTGIQITGRANVVSFRDWCRKLVSGTTLTVPDFEQNPDAMLTDPWEGLGPIWYWSTRNLNRYADQGDFEMITRRINGGTNGFDDRQHWLSRTSLVLLGYDPDDLVGFQKKEGLIADGVMGPRTRAAMHRMLIKLSAPVERSPDVKTAPVTNEVVPEVVDTEVKKKTDFWGRLMTAGGVIGSIAAWVSNQDVMTIVAVGGVAIAGVVVLIVLGPSLAKSIREIRKVTEEA